MSEPYRSSTINFEPQLLDALMRKAEQNQCSVSDVVNDAVRILLIEEQEDMAAIEERASEPVISFDDCINGLKANGRL
ncbi:CopG family transcriptional regulator [bacterium]|nr:CopG family transcriptional regulator [bacterium]